MRIANTTSVALAPTFSSSVPLIASASAPVASAVNCALAQMPKSTWTDGFFEAGFVFSPYRVLSGEGTWSAAQLARCDRLRHKLVKGRQELECYAAKNKTGGGLWVILTTEPSAATPHAQWQIFYNDSRREVSSLPQQASSSFGDPAVAGNDGPSEGVPVALIDLDRDNIEELFTATSQASDAAGNLSTTVTVWTATPKRVEQYPPSASFHAIAIDDSNKDGRPELVIDPYGSTVVGSGVSGWLRSRALWSLAIEFDAAGKAVGNGPASQSYARKLCPSPDALLEALPKADPACIAGYAQCARLWGAPTQPVETAIGAFCDREGKQAPEGAGWCDTSFATWDQIAKQEPPFVLHK